VAVAEAEEDKGPEGVDLPDPGESPDERPGRRRQWPAIVAVAAAVALIGGGLYGARSLGGGPDEQPQGDEAAPLVLDEGPAVADDSVMAEVEAAGGGGVQLAAYMTLNPVGELPDGPDSASDYRFDDGGVGRQRAADLAATLGLDGSVTDAGNSWTVSGTDPGAPTLTVLRGAEGFWSYAGGAGSTGVTGLEDGPDASVSDSDAPISSEAADGSPPSEAEALRVAEPLLAELGLGETEVDASQTIGSQRIVLAAPTVDGLRVNGLATQVLIGPGGELASASGSLAEPVAGEEREVTGAAQALEEFNELASSAEIPAPQCAREDGAEVVEAEPAPMPEPGELASTEPAEPAPAPMPMPEDEGGGSGDQECGSAQRPAPVDVTAEFGLSLHYSADEPVLVPSWLFHTTASDAEPYTLSYPAVPVEYGTASGGGSGDDSDSDVGSGAGGGDDGQQQSEPAEPPAPGQGGGQSGEEGTQPDRSGEEREVRDTGMSIEAYEADGRTLTVHFWGGVCDDYTATADESGEEITVRVGTSGPEREDPCVLVAEEQTIEVELSDPVDGRAVLDARGEEIPVR
jgi:hypothetical protein